MKKIILILILALSSLIGFSQLSVGEYDVKLQSAATGNGVTDDKTMIQNLINSAPAGSSIHFPTAYSYSVSGTITINKVLFLYGNNATIYTTNNIPIFTFLTGSEKSKVQNFRFWGNSTGTLQCAIYCDGGGIIDIFNNTFDNFGGAAFKGKDFENSAELGVSINKNLFKNCAIGLDLQDKAEYVQAIGNKFIGCTKAIVNIGGNSTIADNDISYGVDGITIAYAINSGKDIVHHNQITHNTGYAVKIYSVTQGVDLTDNHVIYGIISVVTTTAVNIRGGQINVASYTFDNNTNFRISDVNFTNTLANTLTQTGQAPRMQYNYKTANGDVAAYVNTFYSEKNNYTLDGTFSIPKGYYIESITFENTTANAVTGGIKIGTTSGGTEVIVAQPVGANELVEVNNHDILKSIFSLTASQTLYIQAVTAWNSADVNMYIKLKQL